MQLCTFCSEPAQFEENISPPVCAKHADLAIIQGFLEDKGEALNVENVTRAYRLVADHGAWTITEEEIAPMLEQMKEPSR